MKKKECDLEHTKLLKIRPSITTDKNTPKEREPKKDEKFEKWNLENIDDSPFSLFLAL